MIGGRLGGGPESGLPVRAEINVTIYMVDSETGQVKASKSVVGESNRTGLGFGYHGSGSVTGDIAGFKKDNLGKATEHAGKDQVRREAE